MVATRSMQRLSPRPIKTNESPGPRVSSAPRTRAGKTGQDEDEAEAMKDPKPEDPRDAAPPEPPSGRAAKGRSRGGRAPSADPATDGELSEAESSCSHASGLQEPTVRITRRRRIVIPCPAEPRGRRRRRSTRSESGRSGDEGDVSEAESCSSVRSSLVASPAPARKTRFQLDPSSALLAEETSDAESWCSGVSSIGSWRLARRRRKGPAEAEPEDRRHAPDERALPSQLESISESPMAPSPGSRPGQEDEAGASEGEAFLRRWEGKKEGPEDANKEPSAVEEQRETSGPGGGRPAPDEGAGKGSTADGAAQETGGDGGHCQISAAAGAPEEKERVEGDQAPSASPASSRSQDSGEFVLLALSSDKEQAWEDSESGEDALCFIEESQQKLSLEKDSEDSPSNDVLFVIDKTPGLSSDKNYYIEEERTSEVASEQENDEGESGEEELVDQEEKEDEFMDEEEFLDEDEVRDEDDLLSNTKSKLFKFSSSIDPGLNIKQLGGLYINLNPGKMDFNKNALLQLKEKTKKELLQKTVITPDFEKDCIPLLKESQFQLKKKRREERNKTAGDGWFGMKAPELTTELKNDLKALQMRASMDPKRFYKKNDRDGFPKYFQVGTIADNPADFYHSRIPKKQRKRTIVEELLADSEFRRYNKRKYTEIMMEKATNAAGKKFRKKKKFRN